MAKLTTEQQASLNEVARCIYEGSLAGDRKAAQTKTDVFQTCALVFKDELDEGLPVSFTLETVNDKGKPVKETVKGVLKAKYSKSWVFIEE